MFAVNVQSISIQQVNGYVINDSTVITSATHHICSCVHLQLIHPDWKLRFAYKYLGYF